MVGRAINTILQAWHDCGTQELISAVVVCIPASNYLVNNGWEGPLVLPLQGELKAVESCWKAGNHHLQWFFSWSVSSAPVDSPMSICLWVALVKPSGPQSKENYTTKKIWKVEKRLWGRKGGRGASNSGWRIREGEGMSVTRMWDFYIFLHICIYVYIYVYIHIYIIHIWECQRIK